MANVTNTNALVKGLQGEMEGIYKQGLQNRPAWVTALMQDAPTDGLYETYHIYEDTGIPTVWGKGDIRTVTSFGDMKLDVYNDEWQMKYTWHANDEMDDRSPVKFINRIRESIKTYTKLDERVLQVMITGTADASVLNRTLLCADGYTYFSASHDMHATSTYGNIVTGSGNPVNTQIVLADFQNKVMRRFNEFVFPNSGEPYFDPAELDSAKKYILCSPQYVEVFKEAFKNTFVTYGDASLSSGAMTNKSNEVARNMNVEVLSWQRITGADWYVFLELPGRESGKPFLKQTREAPQIYDANFQNSDVARETKIKSIYTNARYGFAFSNWFTGIKVDN